MFIFIIVAKILWIYTTFYILIKGVYPKGSWNFQVGLLRWLSRVHLSSYNLTDVYPKFGIKAECAYLKLEIPYNEAPDRLSVLLRFVFVSVLMLPHIFIWTFRNFWSGILTFLAFFAVLFTGKYPKKWFDFNIGTLRWIMRVMGYQLYLLDSYPPFSGKQQ